MGACKAITLLPEAPHHPLNSNSRPRLGGRNSPEAACSSQGPGRILLLHPVYRRRRSVPLPTPPSPLTLRGTPGTPLVGPPTTQLGRPLWFPAGVGPTTLVSSKSTLHQTTLVLTIPPPQIVSSKESTGPQVFQHPSGSTLLWHLLKSKRRTTVSSEYPLSITKNYPPQTATNRRGRLRWPLSPKP